MKADGSIRRSSGRSAASVRTYDVQGRLIKVLEPDETNQPTIETDYTYDQRGNLIRIVQHGKPGDTPRVRIFAYDEHSDLLSATSPESGTTTYTYNPEGRVGSKTDARGITTHYSWDTQGRLVGKQYSNGTPDVVYVYPNDGSRKMIGSYLKTPEGRQAERAYHYNTQGKLDQIIQLGRYSYTVFLGHDAQGRIDKITYPDGSIVRQNWNQANQLVSVSGQDGSPYFRAISYAASGDLQSAILGADIGVQNSFSKRGHLKSLTVSQRNQLLLYKQYDYTGAGSISSIMDAVDPSASFSYRYDNLNRISEATQPGGGFSQSYRYDEFGNLNQEGSLPSEVSYNANNRINTAASVQYDASGELVFDGAHRYRYNPEGRIIDVDDGAIQYTYSAEGDRVEKNIHGAVTEEVWLGDVLLAEKNPDGNWTNYIYANGQRIAKVQGTNTSYYVSDPLGMNRMEISAKGQVLAKGDFAPFGQILSKDSQSPAASMPFTGGEQHDAETGLDTYKFRSYSSKLGRWMSPDPSGEHYANTANPQSLNLYAYVDNDPFKYIDLLGLGTCSDDCPQPVNPIGDPDGCDLDIETCLPQPDPDPDPGPSPEPTNPGGYGGGGSNPNLKACPTSFTSPPNVAPTPLEAAGIQAPPAVSGTLTVSTSGVASSDVSSMISGHAWITFTTDGGVTYTYGTWEDPTGQQNISGVNENTEIFRSVVPDSSLSTHITAAQAGTLANYISAEISQGSAAWSYKFPCSGFASAAWNYATGQQPASGQSPATPQYLDPTKGGILNSPTNLKNAINTTNGGPGCS